jgi:hypothetical protein
MAIRTIRLLAEQDLGKRLAMRDQVQAYLVETWANSPDAPGAPEVPLGGPLRHVCLSSYLRFRDRGRAGQPTLWKVAPLIST